MKKFLYALLITLVSLAFLGSCVIWRSPKYYHLEKHRTIASPVMDMAAYDSIISTHRRPYIYSISAKNGATVSVVGVEHINDESHPQFDSIKQEWDKLNPDIALVEGRLGFLMPLFQDPIEKYGEGGLTSSLAKKGSKKLYTWEPSREDEIRLLLKKYSKEQLAMFYCLRPYLGKKHTDPDARMEELIKSRTDYDGLQNTFQSVADLDLEWEKYYPDLAWRTYSNKRGYMPEGIMSDMWNSSNLARDEHMIQVILESLENKKNVLVTMGVSHAPRIETALRSSIESIE